MLNNLLLYGLTESAELHYLSFKFVATAAILVFNFSLRRHWHFTPPAIPALKHMPASTKP